MVEVGILFSNWLTPYSSFFVLLNIVIAAILFSSAFSNTTNNNHHDDDNDNCHERRPSSPRLARAPSLLSRVTSFNFSHYHHYYSQHHLNYPHQPDEAHDGPTPALSRSPSLLSRVASFRLSGLRRPDPDPTVTESSASQAEDEKEVEARNEPERPKPALSRGPSLLSRVASFRLSGLCRPNPDPTAAAEEEKDVSTNTTSTEEAHIEPRPALTRGPSLLSRVVSLRLRRPTEPDPGPTACDDEEDEEVDAKAEDFISKFKQQLKLQRLNSLMRYRNGGAT